MARRKQGNRAAVRQLGGRGQGKRFPERLRRQAAAYARERVGDGASLAEVAAEIGVSGTSLSRWMSIYDQEPAPRFDEVQIVESAPAGSALLVVRAPGGLVVEGLDVPTLAALLRRLG